MHHINVEEAIRGMQQPLVPNQFHSDTMSQSAKVCVMQWAYGRFQSANFPLTSTDSYECDSKLSKAHHSNIGSSLTQLYTVYSRHDRVSFWSIQKWVKSNEIFSYRNVDDMLLTVLFCINEHNNMNHLTKLVILQVKKPPNFDKTHKEINSITHTSCKWNASQYLLDTVHYIWDNKQKNICFEPLK